MLAAVDDATTRHAVEVERAFLEQLGAGCTFPVGAHVAGRTLFTFLAGDRHVSREVHELRLDDSDLDVARSAATLAMA